MGDSTFKSRNLLVLVFEIIVIVVSIGGLTFATTRLIGGSSNTVITFGDYSVDYIGETEIVATELEPISDKLVDYNTYKNVIRLEFSLRGVETNDNENLIYDVMINELNIDCSLINKYTKWNLYKNGELLYNGSFDPMFDGNILTDNMRLTETQQDLPNYNEEYDKYVLIVWISEACDDLINCEYIDQSNIVNSTLNMKVFIAVSSGDKVLYERVPNLNAICVNKPELYDNMIPVYYDEGNWKLASKTNSEEQSLWYNYGESKWANAVVVNTNKYNDNKVGTIISSEDILGYYVWIPRFKYKLWNSENNITDSYDAYTQGVDIVFESGINSTGTVKCVNDRCLSNNNKYLTHPAFADNLRGFWISKYELSAYNKFIPNVESLKNENLDTYNNIINNINMTYNLGENVFSHVVTNYEWGATLYLSHSKYGVCVDDKCKSIDANNTYISEFNKQDTTTRNVYGVYDMAGAAGEYVVGAIGLGSALEEVLIIDNETWYNGFYSANEKDYVIRGGVDTGLFYVGDIGMTDVSTRGVLVRK